MSAGDTLTRWRGAMGVARMALNARAIKTSPAMNRQAKDRVIVDYTRSTDLLMDHLSLMQDQGDLERIEALLKGGL